MPSLIYRIESRAVWQQAQDSGFLLGEIDRDGFVHCSERHTVLLPANSLFKGQEDLLLLEIDEARVPALIVYEDLYEAGQVFPHIYGELPVSAVVRVWDFPCNDDGCFSLPAELYS